MREINESDWVRNRLRQFAIMACDVGYIVSHDKDSYAGDEKCILVSDNGGCMILLIGSYVAHSGDGNLSKMANGIEKETALTEILCFVDTTALIACLNVL
jgi:hypothetical protein